MSTTRPEDGPRRGSVLRPVFAAVSAAAGCALLQGAVVSKIEPDAGWLQATAVLQGLTLPFAVAAGLLLAVSCPSRARGARGLMAGVMAGLGIFLVPALASFFLASDTLPGRAAAWGALAVWILGCVFLLRSGPVQPGPAPRAPVAVLGVAALGLGALGLLLPGPAPAIGSLQSHSRSASVAGPNVALIVLDTLRADRLSCYGYERPTTPFLDELAARGLRFDAVHSTASHTPPSHATLFSGLLPSETGVMGSISKLPWDLETLAERLSDRGYTTLGVVANFVLRRARNYQQGFQLYDDSLVCPQGVGAAAAAVLSRAAVGELVGRIFIGRRSVAKILNGLTRPRDRRHDAAAVTPLVLRHLEEAARGPGPLFLFVNYMDVHTPYQAPDAERDRFLAHDPGRFRERLGGLEFHRRLDVLAAELRAGKEGPREELAALSDRYDGELHYLDAHLRAFVERFAQISKDRGWLLVITSDHGEQFGEHGEVGHGQGLWEESVRVPLIVAGSDIRPGVVSEPVTLLDLPGTLLHAAGGTAPLGRSGNLLGSGVRKEFQIAERGDPRAASLFPPLDQVAVFSGAEKDLFRLDEAAGAWKFQAAFDWKTDPRETKPRLKSGLGGGPFLEFQEAWWRRYREGRRRTRLLEVTGGESVDLTALGYAGAETETAGN